MEGHGIPHTMAFRMLKKLSVFEQHSAASNISTYLMAVTSNY
jgi:hypothetical protein